MKRQIRRERMDTKKGPKLPVKVREQLTLYLFQHGRSTSDPLWLQRSHNSLNFTTSTGQNFKVLEVVQ